MFRTASTFRPFALVLSLALPLVAGVVPTLASSTAFADPAGGGAAARTTMTGTFQRYLLMPNGRPMGLMLSDGTFVATPGHTLHDDAPVLTTGTRLDIEGVALRTPTGGLVKGAVVKVNGAVIADASQPHGKRHGGQHEKHAHQPLSPQTGAGQIAAIVSGPRGKVRALVLTDGTTAVAHGIEGFGLKVGDKVTVMGKGGVYPLGKSLRIERVTLPNGQTKDVPAPDHGGQGPA